ncbi:MAG: hypothetical protein EBZ69_09975 [Alphaproteobacteria bacterium]|nr:hypothetical protein [Alphaproteobacteria bacterium]
MKILFVYKTCFTESFGGIEQFLHQLALPLAANGHHVTILTLADIKESNELTVANVRVVRCPISLSISSNSISLKALGIFRQMAAQHDVVHFNIKNFLHGLCQTAGITRRHNKTRFVVRVDIAGAGAKFGADHRFTGHGGFQQRNAKRL